MSRSTKRGLIFILSVFGAIQVLCVALSIPMIIQGQTAGWVTMFVPEMVVVFTGLIFWGMAAISSWINATEDE